MLPQLQGSPDRSPRRKLNFLGPTSSCCLFLNLLLCFLLNKLFLFPLLLPSTTFLLSFFLLPKGDADLKFSARAFQGHSCSADLDNSYQLSRDNVCSCNEIKGECRDNLTRSCSPPPGLLPPGRASPPGPPYARPASQPDPQQEC